MADEIDSTREPEQAGELDAAIDQAIESQSDAEPDVTQAAAPAVEDAAGKEPDQAGNDDKASENETPADSVDIPADFPKDRREALSKLPPEARKVVLDQYKEFQAGFTKKTQELAEERKAFGAMAPVKQVIDHYQPYFRSRGIEPARAVATLIAAEHLLATGTPEQKAGYIQKLARDYGVDLSQGSEAAPVDPTIASLEDRLARAERAVIERERREQEERQASYVSEIQEFQAQKNQDGTPKYPHFEAVKVKMGKLLQAAEADTLEAAYAKAIRLDDTLYRETLESERKAVAAEEARRRQEAVEKAKAATSKAGRSEDGRFAKKAASLDEAIDSAMSAIS